MSTLKVATIQDTSGNNSSTPAGIASGTAKAWVNFNGTGTVSINDDFNVDSITDNGTGDYTINFLNAMANANYCVASTLAVISDQGSTYGFGIHYTLNGPGTTNPTTKTTSALRVLCRRESDNDMTNASVAIFGA